MKLIEMEKVLSEASGIGVNTILSLHSERWCGIMDAKQIIINAPFMSDRPQGEWIATRSQCGWKCSLCGTEYRMLKKGNFCSNCGADMRNRKESE